MLYDWYFLFPSSRSLLGIHQRNFKVPAEPPDGGQPSEASTWEHKRAGDVFTWFRVVGVFQTGCASMFLGRAIWGTKASVQAKRHPQFVEVSRRCAKELSPCLSMFLAPLKVISLLLRKHRDRGRQGISSRNVRIWESSENVILTPCECHVSETKNPAAATLTGAPILGILLMRDF